MAHKEATVIRCPQHLAWVRGHICALASVPVIDADALCHSISTEAAHVRIGTDGSMAKKPGDNWAIPLCGHHHHVQHQIGERSFEARYGIHMKAIASALWAKSPAGIKYRANRQRG